MTAVLAAALLLPALAAGADAVSIGVFGLFEPERLLVRPAEGRTLRLTVDGAPRLLEGGEALAVSSERVESDGPAEFRLAVPGKLERRFEGKLRITPAPLQAVVEMDVETAVAAVLAAEASRDWPAAALEAQAIVSRSYLLGPARHAGFDFCDTTHCQYLTAGDSSTIQAAVERTAGATLSGAEPLFTRSCGGERCELCRRDPVRWRREYPAAALRDVLAKPGVEAVRLAFVRRRGWDALPSNTYEIRRQGDHVVLHGRGEGHGLGLCQRGAAAMARAGATVQQILDRYF